MLSRIIEIIIRASYYFHQIQKNLSDIERTIYPRILKICSRRIYKIYASQNPTPRIKIYFTYLVKKCRDITWMEKNYECTFCLHLLYTYNIKKYIYIYIYAKKIKKLPHETYFHAQATQFFAYNSPYITYKSTSVSSLKR